MVYLEGNAYSTTICGTLIVIYQALSAVWVHKLCSRLSPGTMRLLAVGPVIIVNCMAPLVFDQDYIHHPKKERAMAGYIFMTFLVVWLCNCKILGYALNRGYLAKVENWPTWKFVGVFMLPIQPKFVKPDEKNLSKEEPSIKQELLWRFKEFARLVLSVAIKVGFLLLWAVMVVKKWSLQGPYGDALTYNGILLMWLGQTFDIAQIVALALFNITCVDSFNHPYLSVDFTEMWSQRWNTMTAGVMRTISYDIIRDGFFVRPSDEVLASMERRKLSHGRMAVAVMSTFLLSGLLHFMVFWYITKTYAWTWFFFFAVFGPIVIVEGVVKNYFQKSLGIKSVPKYLSLPFGIAYTMGLATVLSSIWFVPIALDEGGQSLLDFYQKRLLGSYAVSADN